MKILILFSSLWALNAFALLPSPAECNVLIKEYNKKFGAHSSWGIDKNRMSLVMFVTKGNKASEEQKAMNSKVKRICMSAGLKLDYYQAQKGSSSAHMYCQITTPKNLYGVCEASTAKIELGDLK